MMISKSMLLNGVCVDKMHYLENWTITHLQIWMLSGYIVISAVGHVNVVLVSLITTFLHHFLEVNFTFSRTYYLL